MSNIHKTLHLQHHRHSGRLLHHRHTSYRGLLVLLVAAGVFMAGLNVVNHETAAAFDVGATVKAPIPSTPPIITSPSDNTTLTSDSQVVMGNCPVITPQVTITVSVDGVDAGSGICDTNNDFAVPIRLSSGSHAITARSVTITGDAGPATGPITLLYKAPSTKTTSHITSQPNGVVNTPNPIKLTPDGTVLYLGGENRITWSGTISGGTPPYKVLINWGDGTRKTYDQAAGVAAFDHTYDVVQPYNMSISVTDAANVALHEQFAVTTYATASLAVSSTTTPTSPLGSNSSVVGLYGLYLTVLAVFGIAWLEAKHAAKELAHGH